jgi:hypothetical protein
MSDVNTLHDDDFFAWSKEQANALRAATGAGSNLRLDWANLAEEIEGLGISQRSALESQVRRVIEHLLKLENSRAPGPRRGWRESIVDARIEIEAILERNPSLGGELEKIFVTEQQRGSRKAIAGLERHRELDQTVVANIRAATYTADQILGDWLPPEPAK